MVLIQEGLPAYGPSLQPLSLQLSHFPQNRHDIVRLTITDEHDTRWRIPASILPNIYAESPRSQADRDANTSSHRSAATQHALAAQQAGSLQYSVSPNGEQFRLTVQREPQCLAAHCKAGARESLDSPASENSHAGTCTGACTDSGPGARTAASGAAAASRALFQLSSFAFKDQYLELSSSTPASSHLLGLAEQSRTTGASPPTSSPLTSGRYHCSTMLLR